MMYSMIFLHTTIIMLFVLAVRIKLWKKSISTFVFICMTVAILALYKLCSHDMFMTIHPIIISVTMFILTLKAILKESNDRWIGNMKWGGNV